MSLSAGSKLGPYEILSLLGAGGMGEVYKARDTRLERTVAVKVLPAQTAASPEARQRFEREARTISQLAHPHICALYDVGREGDTEYLVMELLEGEALSDRLAKGPLAREQSLRFGEQIADALDKAHRQGVVHRDLKPANVMLTKTGVKLLDFGLAKGIAAAGSGAGSVTYAGKDGVLMAAGFETSNGRARVRDPQPLFPLLLGSGGAIDTSRRSYDVAPDGGRFLVVRKALDAENDDAVVVLNWTAVLAQKERP